jgi:hypothetical protein
MASTRNNESGANQPEQKQVSIPAEKQRQQDSGREDPVEPNEVGTAKETTTVRGHGESQSVRHSG